MENEPIWALFKGFDSLSLYFEARIRIRNRIKVKDTILIRIKVASRIRIHIKVMRIHNTGILVTWKARSALYCCTVNKQLHWYKHIHEHWSSATWNEPLPCPWGRSGGRGSPDCTHNRHKVLWVRRQDQEIPVNEYITRIQNGSN